MASSLDESTVRHVAHLARLHLSADEVARFAQQLSSVVDYVKQLNELDTSDVPPTTHPLPLRNVFREDTTSASWEPDQALHNAPKRRGDFFEVPRVLDQDSA